MATNSRVLEGISPHDVFDVLRDGHSYADWVVGTRMIRSVEPGWPAPGTALHFTVGYLPLRKDDKTTSTAYVADSELSLQAHAWPAGSARIVLRAEETATGTRVTIEEAPDRGIAKVLHNPLIDLAIKLRNVETLRRLEGQVRRRGAGSQPG